MLQKVKLKPIYLKTNRTEMIQSQPTDKPNLNKAEKRVPGQGTLTILYERKLLKKLFVVGFNWLVIEKVK
jgi:hypothetical protein